MFLKTSERFWWQMRQLNKHNNLRKDSAYAFDSAWVVAMALDSAFAKGMKYEKLLNRKFKQVVAIRSGIQNINFAGLTVSIIYDNTADFELSVLSIRIMLHYLLIFLSLKDSSTFKIKFSIFCCTGACRL